MVYTDDLGDLFPADGAAVVAVDEQLGAGITGDHVVAGAQQAVTRAVHADGAVSVMLHPRC